MPGCEFCSLGYRSYPAGSQTYQLLIVLDAISLVAVVEHFTYVRLKSAARASANGHAQYLCFAPWDRQRQLRITASRRIRLGGGFKPVGQTVPGYFGRHDGPNRAGKARWHEIASHLPISTGALRGTSDEVAGGTNKRNRHQFHAAKSTLEFFGKIVGSQRSAG